MNGFDGFGYTTKQGIQMTQSFFIYYYFILCLACSLEPTWCYFVVRRQMQPMHPWPRLNHICHSAILHVESRPIAWRYSTAFGYVTLFCNLFFFSHAPPSYLWTDCCNGLLNTYYTSVWALQCGLGYFESAPCRLDWLQQLQPRGVRVLWAGDFHLPKCLAVSLSALDETTDERCQKSKILTCLCLYGFTG